MAGVAVEPLDTLGKAITDPTVKSDTVDDDGDVPPPVPSRLGRRSVSSSPSPSPAQGLNPVNETSFAFIPPPLPPRIVPSPINTVSPPTPRVEITPATPAQPLSPATGTTASFGQMGEEIRGASVPVTMHSTRSQPTASTPLPEKVNQVIDDPPLSAKGIPAVDQAISHLKLPPVEAIVIGALVLNLLVGRLSILVVLLIGGGYAAYKQLELNGKTIGNHPSPDPYVRSGEGKEAVQWVNHALYALFPLISTDVLTPFIDLLEDALIAQVPPIVTSVRLTSAALGAQPMLLNSLRPMSDSEWFASLAPHTRPAHESSPNSKPSRPVAKAHKRTGSSSSRMSRSASYGSNISAMDPDEVALEANKRRKRDRILQKVSRRQQHISGPSSSAAAHSLGRGNLGSRPHYDGPLDEAQDTGGEHAMEGAEDDDPNAGQYVNYQVGFEYKRTETTKKKGWGLHVLVSLHHWKRSS